MNTQDGDITILLRQLTEGDNDALDRVMPMLYDELRGMARSRLKHERDGHTLEPTALVNEVYLKLARHQRINAESRTQFFAVAARTMRRVLVDYARTKKRLKRGGGAAHVPIEEVEPFLSEKDADELLALEDALNRFAKMNPRGAEVVELRFFSGLTLEETAQLLGVSVKTAQRDWIAARAWLHKEVSKDLRL